MAATVLNSLRAVQMTVFVVRAFVKMRESLLVNAVLAREVAAPGGRMLDIAGLVRAAPANAHFYCCGPLPMLDAFEKATQDLPRDRVHVEYFTAKAPPALEGGFTIVLAKSGLTLAVAPGKTILDTLRDNGFDTPFSCTEGVCGTCETRVLEGIPDHRDLILTEAERASNKTMLICCSGSKSDKLVLDL